MHEGKSVVLNRGTFSSGDILQGLETFLVVTMWGGEVPLASSG